MNYSYYEKDGKQNCEVFADKSSANGLLRFTHEITVWFVKENDEWKYNGAWHIGVSEVSYDKDDPTLFEIDNPGLLKEIMKGLE